VASRVIWVWKDTSIAEDRIAVEFAEVLEGLGVKYAIVADYVTILLGRSRRGEDVDFIVEPISEDAFLELAGRLRARGFALLQGDIGSVGSLRSIYSRYLKEGLGLRFTYRRPLRGWGEWFKERDKWLEESVSPPTVFLDTSNYF